MIRFILSKLLYLVPTFLGITIIAFSFVRILPGDPVLLMAGERGVTPERHAELTAIVGQPKGQEEGLVAGYGEGGSHAFPANLRSFSTAVPIADNSPSTSAKSGCPTALPTISTMPFLCTLTRR